MPYAPGGAGFVSAAPILRSRRARTPSGGPAGGRSPEAAATSPPPEWARRCASARPSPALRRGRTTPPRPIPRRRWERPGLRSEIAHPADPDPGFFQDFAAHRLFQGFAGLHVAGKAGIAAADPPAVAPQQAALAFDRQHDHDRIDPRIMMRPALRTLPPPPARRDRRRIAALGAKAVPRVPIEERTGFGQDGRVGSRDLGGKAADVGGEGVVFGLRRGGGRVERKMRPPPANAEQDQSGAAGDRRPPPR